MCREEKPESETEDAKGNESLVQGILAMPSSSQASRGNREVGGEFQWSQKKDGEKPPVEPPVIRIMPGSNKPEGASMEPPL